MPVASPTATRRFSATSPDYEFAVPGFRPTGNTSHLFGRETTQFDATPTQLDLSDDDNDTPFVIAPAPQRPPPYQRAPIGDVQESIERAIEMLRARIEARKKTWPDGRPSRYYDDVPGVEESKGDRNYPDGDRPEPYGGDYEDESDDEDDSDGAGSPEDDSDDDDDSDDEDDSDSDDERRGAEVEAIRNFGLISRDPRKMQELSAVVDNAEMRTIEGEPETIEQRDLANQIARAIAGTSSFTKADTLDSSGKPKALSELMRMARVTSLWPVLSELQRSQLLDTPGVLANDRHYIARNVLIGAPIRKKRPFVQNAQGKIIYV